MLWNRRRKTVSETGEEKQTLELLRQHGAKMTKELA